MFILYKNARALQPDFTIKKQNILIQDEQIYDIFDAEEMPNKPLDEEIDLEGKLLFPGLINSHDHLIDTLWKKFGETPASSWIDWRKTVINDEDYKLAQRLSVADLYTLGMYKNIISGTTTIIDHFPIEVSMPFMDHTLATLLKHSYIAHSVSEKSLKWCGNIQEQYRNTSGILPFIVHMGEGNTKELLEELESLNRMGALNDNTVLINGTFLDEDDIQLIAAQGASVVWLPNSSKEIYGKQPKIKEMLEAGIRISIGTDGANTGSSTMQAEFATALKYGKEYCPEGLTPQKLLKMSTINAAKAFRIYKEVGSIEIGKTANFVVFENKIGADPFESFIRLKPEEMELVVHKGKMVFGDNEFRRIPTVDFNQYSEILINGSVKVVYGRPLQLLERIRHKLDVDVSFPFFNIEIDE
jgi:5-methylthioadenosine/S-adenosylhomocysteine deaminase